MNTNRGKQFEQQIRQALDRLEDSYVFRIPDQMTGYMGSKNPCDFIVYRYPNLYLLECKCCYGTSFSYKNITPYQQQSLIYAGELISGVVAGYLIWFIDRGSTVFISADYVAELQSQGKKSLSVRNLTDDRILRIKGKKRNILYDYDLSDLIKGEGITND